MTIRNPSIKELKTELIAVMDYLSLRESVSTDSSGNIIRPRSSTTQEDRVRQLMSSNAFLKTIADIGDIKPGDIELSILIIEEIENIIQQYEDAIAPLTNLISSDPGSLVSSLKSDIEGIIFQNYPDLQNIPVNKISNPISAALMSPFTPFAANRSFGELTSISLEDTLESPEVSNEFSTQEALRRLESRLYGSLEAGTIPRNYESVSFSELVSDALEFSKPLSVLNICLDYLGHIKASAFTTPEYFLDYRIENVVKRNFTDFVNGSLYSIQESGVTYLKDILVDQTTAFALNRVTSEDGSNRNVRTYVSADPFYRGSYSLTFSSNGRFEDNNIQPSISLQRWLDNPSNVFSEANMSSLVDGFILDTPIASEAGLPGATEIATEKTRVSNYINQASDFRQGVIDSIKEIIRSSEFAATEDGSFVPFISGEGIEESSSQFKKSGWLAIKYALGNALSNVNCSKLASIVQIDPANAGNRFSSQGSYSVFGREWYLQSVRDISNIYLKYIRDFLTNATFAGEEGGDLIDFDGEVINSGLTEETIELRRQVSEIDREIESLEDERREVSLLASRYEYFYSIIETAENFINSDSGRFSLNNITYLYGRPGESGPQTIQSIRGAEVVTEYLRNIFEVANALGIRSLKDYSVTDPVNTDRSSSLILSVDRRARTVEDFGRDEDGVVTDNLSVDINYTTISQVVLNSRTNSTVEVITPSINIGNLSLNFAENADFLLEDGESIEDAISRYRDDKIQDLFDNADVAFRRRIRALFRQFINSISRALTDINATERRTELNARINSLQESRNELLGQINDINSTKYFEVIDLLFENFPFPNVLLKPENDVREEPTDRELRILFASSNPAEIIGYSSDSDLVLNRGDRNSEDVVTLPNSRLLEIMNSVISSMLRDVSLKLSNINTEFVTLLPNQVKNVATAYFLSAGIMCRDLLVPTINLEEGVDIDAGQFDNLASKSISTYLAFMRDDQDFVDFSRISFTNSFRQKIKGTIGFGDAGSEENQPYDTFPQSSYLQRVNVTKEIESLIFNTIPITFSAAAESVLLNSKALKTQFSKSSIFSSGERQIAVDIFNGFFNSTNYSEIRDGIRSILRSDNLIPVTILSLNDPLKSFKILEFALYILVQNPLTKIQPDVFDEGVIDKNKVCAIGLRKDLNQLLSELTDSPSVENLKRKIYSVKTYERQLDPSQSFIDSIFLQNQDITPEFGSRYLQSTVAYGQPGSGYLIYEPFRIDYNFLIDRFSPESPQFRIFTNERNSRVTVQLSDINFDLLKRNLDFDISNETIQECLKNFLVSEALKIYYYFTTGFIFDPLFAPSVDSDDSIITERLIAQDPITRIKSVIDLFSGDSITDFSRIYLFPFISDNDSIEEFTSKVSIYTGE